MYKIGFIENKSILLNRVGCARFCCLVVLFFFLLSIDGCATKAPEAQQADKLQAKEDAAALSGAIKDASPHAARHEGGDPRPGVDWKPSYSIQDVSVKTGPARLPDMPLGYDIDTTKTGRQKLSDIINFLAEKKDMSVSWASDVNQDALVGVSARADDNFWQALSNILRQKDYFFEFKDNTIIVKYRDTQKFYLSLPFVTAAYNTSIGGNMIGGSNFSQGTSGYGNSTTGQQENNMKGIISVKHTDDNIDLWGSIQENLNKILGLSKTQQGGAQQGNQQQGNTQAGARQAGAQGNTQAAAQQDNGAGKPTINKSYFTIDKSLGSITVTAPRSVLKKVENYLDTLKRELSRQVIIEAKILEITLNKNTQQGIDWSGVLKNSPFQFQLTFGNNGLIVPKQGAKFISQVGLYQSDPANNPLKFLVNAIGEYGNVKVLSDPKISLLNGQAAMMTVGTNIKYLSKVTSTTSTGAGTNTITYTTETGDILNGLGMGVMANISSDDEVVLHLTPVTSQLVKDPIDYVTIGSAQSGFAEVGLPRVFLRELTTMARVKDGQILVVGGLIDESKTKNETKVPILGDIPYLGKVFKNTQNTIYKRELVILIRPKIVNM